MTVIVEEDAILRAKSDKKKNFLPERTTSSTGRKLTVEQAEEVASGRSFELIDGEVVYKMPDSRHADVQGLLCIELGVYLKKNQIGRIRPEYMIRPWPDKPLEGRTPDLSVILNENFNPKERYASRAPDIAIEIVSSNDLWNDLFDKTTLYLEHGSQEVWIVDPFQRGVEVITKEDRRWVKDVLTSPILPNFSVEINHIFDWPEAEPAKSGKSS